MNGRVPPLQSVNTCSGYGPETTGLIDPIMIAAKKNDTVSDTEVYVSEASGKWLIERAMAQANLRKDGSEKWPLSTIIMGQEKAIGASYLQVIPSICNLLNGMYDAGYNVDTNMIPNETELLELIVHQGTNIGSWAPGGSL